jgi:phosphate starvation-inducible protein PhoH
MRDAWRRLQGLEGVSFVSLTQQDIVRHRLVQQIVSRYDSPGGSSPYSDETAYPGIPETSE